MFFHYGKYENNYFTIKLKYGKLLNRVYQILFTVNDAYYIKELILKYIKKE